jgi:hypothetical protein
MRATEIRRVEYLKRGVVIAAQGGVFKVSIDKDVLPDGWLDDDDTKRSVAITNKNYYYYSETF